MRLLIVDDGHYIVEYLKHLLEWKKFGVEHIETTTNSIEARQRLDQRRFDILITDIRMPEVSGIDLLQHVSASKLDTKVVFLSGFSDFAYTQKAIQLGAVDYLLKPVDKDDMERSMRQVVKSIAESHVRHEDVDSGEHSEIREAALVPEPRVNDRVIAAIHAYIADHLGDCISLDDLGKVVHLHPVYLSKLYKQETGENLSGYISRQRLDKAARLLTGSSLHVLDIARLVGYRKPQYFIKLFKEQYGLTPQQFRLQQLRQL